MHLAVVNISYLKFSSNARGIIDSDREVDPICYSYRSYLQEEEKKDKKNNVGKNGLIGSRTG